MLNRKEYYIKNREKLLQQGREYYLKNKDKKKRYSKTKARKYNLKYQKENRGHRRIRHNL